MRAVTGKSCSSRNNDHGRAAPPKGRMRANRFPRTGLTLNIASYSMRTGSIRYSEEASSIEHRAMDSSRDSSVLDTQAPGAGVARPTAFRSTVAGGEASGPAPGSHALLARPLVPRAERFSPAPGQEIRLYDADREPRLLGTLQQISSTGLSLVWSRPSRALAPGMQINSLLLRAGKRRLPCGSARIVRGFEIDGGGARGKRSGAGVAFDFEQSGLIDMLADRLTSAGYVNSELSREQARNRIRTSTASENTIDKFYSRPGPDLFAKCNDFRSWIDDMQARGLYQRFFRVTVTGALDNRIVVFDPLTRRERPMLCFDSNSYLSLHRHPRVLERVAAVLKEVGYGTPSAQLLGGTNRHLRELENEICALHGREDAIVFPNGFAANTGTLGALLRFRDAVLRDRFAHASIHEACRGSAARFNRIFRHNDMVSLEGLLIRAAGAGCEGKLIVTDGVFSMHGRIAPLPELVKMAKRHGARLMVDDAHGTGVLGATGGGIEEYYAMPGSIDVLVGTLSKTFGALGGYVCGSRDLLYYLRFFAPTSMFTTSLPAPLCAGISEAIRVMRDEPEHLARLWQNIRLFGPALAAAGFIVPEPQSAIVTLFLGSEALMYEFNRELFDAGIKCSSVAYPAVPKGDAILRMTLNASHTDSDLLETVEILTKVGKKLDVLRRSETELRQIGRSRARG